MRVQDIVIGLIIVVIWGINFIFIKLGVQDIPPLLLGVLRFLVASIPAIFFLPRPPITWRWLIALGLTINVGQFGFLFLGMKLGMPAGIASLLLQSQSFFTLAIAVMLTGEQWHLNNLLGLGLSAVGMAIIGFQQGGSMTITGFCLTLAAAISWGVGNIIMRKTTKDLPTSSMLALVVWSGAVSIIPLAILSLFVEGFSSWQTAWHSHTSIAIGSVFYLAYFASLGAYTLWAKLLSRYPATTVAPFSLLVPVIGMSSAALFLGEAISFSQVLGALLVMAGLVVHVFGEHFTNRKAKIFVDMEKDNMISLRKV